MASGWASDDAVNQQIESTIADALNHVRQQMDLAAESAEFCEECGEEIPLARRQAIQGVRFCVSCQTDRDKERQKTFSLYNRRGSKDSQLR
ncbi:DksA/TraR family C4-type zinc finger protein [Snodgrassella communis]|uniref:DksA/TraR family C4-type zinc finger protein n=1 Tax=Snodgrassella communis TaxID=2946699 RepID=UPI001EF4F0C4|nr:DksA/TraR family C4-type zinc finger protein [Snodgrassella communis]WMY91578.1 DksA/TraR family C4-type zinc finger protein [Snodgrassella communis]